MWPFQSFAGDKSDILHHSSSFDASVESASAGFTMLPTSEHSYDALQFAEQSLQHAFVSPPGFRAQMQEGVLRYTLGVGGSSHALFWPKMDIQS